MFCLSCGKKISKISKFCKHCGEKNDNEKNKKFVENKKIFYLTSFRNFWAILWLITMVVFVLTLVVITKFEESNVILLNNIFLLKFFLFNICLGIVSFIFIFFTKIIPKKPIPKFIRYGFIFFLLYLIINPAVFAIEGYKAKTNEEYKNRYYVEITPTPIPTIETIVTPTTTSKKSIQPTQKAIDTDPIIDCVSSSPNCNGSSIKLRRSQCSNITCCQIGNNWSVYPSSEKCKEAQNSAKPQTVNNPQIVPTTAVYIPNANKSPVFLSYSGYTTYCPSQNVDAVKSINSTMESKKSEWASKYNECTDTFIKTDSCWVSCSNTAFNELSFCSSTLDYKSSEYTSCRDKALDNQSLCLNKCPSSSNACQWVYSEQKNLSSQISNLCK